MKYQKNNVKRQHTIIEGLLPVLEDLGTIPGVRVIPGKIFYSPRGKADNTVRIKFTPTLAGIKLLAKVKDGTQEIFLVYNRDTDILETSIKNKLSKYIYI